MYEASKSFAAAGSMRLGELSLGHAEDAEDGSLTNLTLAGRAVEVAPKGEL